MTDWIRVEGTVMQGYGVASGRAADPRYPQGTIQMQKPIFAKQGVNLEDYFAGTINVSIQPHQYSIKKSKHTLKNVRWTSGELTEDFSFCDCNLIFSDRPKLKGLIYYPHPETKPEHFQSPDVLEIITYYINGLNYGDRLILELNSAQIEIIFSMQIGQQEADSQ
ncbi:MAG: hypothetical protein NW224_15155 [Leptolyngbyaceae cyanobacterium bins.302]|nr:hypothetical protein [Leptolyngbyaceae cyanobacterium bins.302]